MMMMGSAGISIEMQIDKWLSYCDIHFQTSDFQLVPTQQNILAGNVAVAFSLNLITANYLKHGSPLALLLTNLIKVGADDDPQKTYPNWDRN